ncbi:MAG: MerR family transcriptional regulator, partial [Acidobacteriota bacterium]
LRAWEKRYGAVEPARTEGGHRLYSEAEIRRLQLLHRLTEMGHRIGRIATVPTGELDSMLEAARRDASTVRDRSEAPEAEDWTVVQLMEAVRELDADQLESSFRQAALERTAHGLIEEVISPLLRRIGEAWQEGEVSPAQEHLASRVVSHTLSWVLDAFQPPPDAPLAVIATPSGQRHELGALLAAATAAASGWRIAYLGGDLPGEEIARAARATGARAVALSIVYPPDDPGLGEEMRALRAGLGDDTRLLVGGDGTPAYARVLEEVGARTLDGYGALRSELEALDGR